jgi:hypothetical protein
VKRGSIACALSIATLAAPLMAQQPLRGDEAMPAGHPTVGAASPARSAPAAAGSAPKPHARPSEAAAGSTAAAPHAGAQLPSGHPPLGEQPSARPARDEDFTPPPDTSALDKQLPAGSIRARIVDPKEAPLGQTEVRLGILHQTIAEGEARDQRLAKTDAEGWVRFDGLKVGSDYSYRVTVVRGAATYASSPFNLSREFGHSVLLHIYPVVRDVSQALVGMRGYVSVEPRDDVFQFEGMFQIFNIGPVAWVPDGVTIELPKDYKAAKGEESMSDVRFETDDNRGLRLEGTISPGQHQASFRFQVPREGGDSATFRLSLPPHVAEQQVITLSAPGMSLNVDGFPAAKPATTQNGQRILGTARRLHQGEDQMQQLVITLAGIPGPGPARWVASAIAAAAALGGLLFAWQNRSGPARGGLSSLAQADAEQAKEILITELVQLEAARSKDEIGPKTYESARRSLLDALARLEASLPTLARTPHQG